MPKRRKSANMSILNTRSRISNDPYTLYLDSLSVSGRRSMRSLLKNQLGLMTYKGAAEAFPWYNLRYAHLVKLRTLMQKQGKSINTVNTALAAVKGVVRTAFHMGMMSAEDYLHCRSVKAIRNHQLPFGRSLTDQEVKKMLSVCKKDRDMYGIRDAALISLMLSTGLRRSEVVSLNRADYDARKNSLVVRHGKGNHQRQAPVSASTKTLVKRWLKCMPSNSHALFTRVMSGEVTTRRITGQSVYNIVVSRSQQAGIKRCTPHDLRRTLVTRLLENKIDLNTIRRIVGHQSLDTTARYDRRDDKAARSAIRKLAVH